MQLQIRDRLDAVAINAPIPPVRRLDWAFAGALAVVALVFVLLDDTLPVWARIVPAVVSVGFVPFRRRIPLAGVVVANVALAICVALAISGSDQITDVGSPAGLADVVLFYALCRWSTPQRIAIGFSVYLAGEVTILWSTGVLGVDAWVSVLPLLVVAGFALAMRYRAGAIESRHAQVRLEERNSLARELHDTVAHHVSAIAVQAQAGQYVIESDPGAAAEVLRSIESIANDSIDEMRHMVGVLRSEDDLARRVAPDTLDVLAEGSGRPTVHVSGDTRLDELPAGVAAALFRIAQESITNARRHSRGVTFVDVAVERHLDGIQMVVDNDGTPTTRNSGSGFGQVGMRERVEVLGGTFESAARPGIGWRTSTSIPLARVDR